MTLASATIAAIRFGYGFHPRQKGQGGIEAVLAQLGARDLHPGGQSASLAARAQVLAANREARQAARRNASDAQALKRRADRAAQTLAMADTKRMIARAVASRAGFRERLAWFWSDHFTVSAVNRPLRVLVPDMIETAIRPHVSGRFADMLWAVVTHPAMLIYLDQVRSVGPRSLAGRRGNRGLNENLAREVLELHTLGVGAGYRQNDVRQLAELLTGLSVSEYGFRFRPGIAEPGVETVLGRDYSGPGTNGLDEIRRALDDLAMRPETADHLARKLLVHFIGDTPDPRSVAHVATAYLKAGALGDAYEALLELPEAWSGPFRKAKQPFGYIVSTLRALGAGADHVLDLDGKALRRGVLGPMLAMGQRPWAPPGPDGWAEAPEAWITAAGLAARIRWARAVAETRGANRDPGAFLNTALGDAAGPFLSRAVAGAETRAEGISLVLASPQFNRC